MGDMWVGSALSSCLGQVGRSLSEAQGGRRFPRSYQLA